MNDGKLNFVLIGAKGTGKTLFLVSLFAKSSSISAKNAYTIDYLKPLTERVISGKLPEATASRMVELSFSYQSANYSVDFFIDDYDGFFVESLHEKDKTTTEERTLLLNHIKYSNGIIFLFPTEKEFRSKSIRNFKYEVDTFINSIKGIYKDYAQIPIPAVIAVTKWDKSYYFKSEDEEERAIEYIESHDFLNEVKSKIENFFEATKVIPVSAVSNRDNNLKIEPYNIEKPIEFFLNENYILWEKKINELLESGEEDKLFQFLYNIVYDMRFYQEGKYLKLYQKLEKERFNKIDLYLKESINKPLKVIKEELKERGFEYLQKESKEKIEKILEEKREKDKKIKKYYRLAILTIFLLFISIFTIKYYKNKEDVFFSKIIEYYKNNNYNIAIKDIDNYFRIYQNNNIFGFYSDEILKHKKRLNEIRSKMFSQINQKYQKEYNRISNIETFQKYYIAIKRLYEALKDKNYLPITAIVRDKYRELSIIMKHFSNLNLIITSGRDMDKISKEIVKLQEYSNFKDIKKSINYAMNIQKKNLIMTKVYEVLSSNNIRSGKVIDNLIRKMITYKIDDKEIIKKLMLKKKSIQLNRLFNKFVVGIKNKDFNEAFAIVKNSWSSKFTEKNREEIVELLDAKFNQKVKSILDEINLKITTLGEFREYKKRILKIKEMANSKIYEINYTPVMRSSNFELYKKAKNVLSIYQDIIKNGIIPSISFGTSSLDGKNSPLGFECDSFLGESNEIILEINDNVYNYGDSLSCTNNVMRWENFAPYKATNYNVTVKEVNFIGSDNIYKSSFKLTLSDLFMIYNNGAIKIDIGNSYYLILKKQ